jgi:uncharacterized membrane protein
MAGNRNPALSQPLAGKAMPDDKAALLAQAEANATAIRQTELLISAILRGGVLLSGGVTLLGLLLLFVHNPGASARLAKMQFPHTPGAVLTGIAHGDPLAVIMLGLLLLIATPVSRIAVSILAFAVEKDWRYVAITAVVLAILLISFILGKAGG